MIVLRDMRDEDYAPVFAFQRDAVASRMAAFGRRDADADALRTRWRAGEASGTILTQKVIVMDGAVVGFAACFLHEGVPDVTYWVDRAFWGKGVATAALRQLIEIVKVRPLRGSAAKDNTGSLRVLEKCGFKRRGERKDWADVRGEEIEEVLLELE